MKDYTKYIETNRSLWNQKTPFHEKSSFYNVPEFKQGACSLNPPELKALGDVTNKTLLHLQCHFGMDTLSWARRGAIATGVDLSDEAIKLARSLSTEINTPADFIRCNLYDLPEHLDKQFDIVFTSYGTIGWLPNMNQWAALIAKYLKPGGTFYIIEFHQLVWLFEKPFSSFKIVDSYFHNGTQEETTVGTYAQRDADINHQTFYWNHSMSSVINALIKNGLEINEFNEYPFSCYDCLDNLEQREDGYWYVKDFPHTFPMMFSIKATKK